ncbi:F-box only protein 39-like [Littorina saxatilis]|uniref:F-box only protein 39-like n=1 Tax=Littorina saxatilis TaxID=31220 RepID=UPI0038B6AF28
MELSKAKKDVPQNMRGETKGHINETSRCEEDVSQDMTRNRVGRAASSLLPEAVWVRVMELLALPDKYHMTITCSLFNRLFYTPSLWRYAILDCRATQAKTVMSSPILRLRQYSSVSRCRFSDQQTAMVQTFGRHIQHAKLLLPYGFTGLTEDAVHTVTNLLENGSLKSLYLDLNVQAQALNKLLRRGRVLEHCGVRVVLDHLKKAVNLERLTIHSWCFPLVVTSESPQCDVVKVLTDGELCCPLRSLSIAWRLSSAVRGSSHGLCHVDPAFKSPTTALKLVSKFQSLQHLELLHVMISDELFEELATAKSKCRAPLLTLSVVQRFSCRKKSPTLSPASWSLLTSACPRLDVTLDTDVRETAPLAWILRQPCVPLTTLRLRRLRGHLVTEVLRQLLRFKPTLRALYCADTRIFNVEETESVVDSDYDAVLLNVVKQCSRIEDLVVPGVLFDDTVRRLKELERNWRKFDVKTVRDTDGGFQTQSGGSV